ncbi:MAG: NnrS family protein [endosymbiont of Galathealinum brachiosum]|uniref:NnrS family protein n=1 Tax=endosymbiont of Galathealinum brachiosum TaxID=2200906 RepID=A0A370DI09_9GAMM|nr:MAG: NnrS family protein [endosymbiont of Galathealinum brachiosum]
MKTFWNTFNAAPHRLFFFSGAIQLILPLLLWSIELIGRYTELWTPLNTVIPSTWAHGFVMMYGLFIFFIFGFLMTVFPRWMNAALINKEHYIQTFIVLNAGLIIFETSLFFNKSFVFSGLGIFLFGWVYGTAILYQSFKHAPAQNKRYEKVVLAALTSGAFGIASYGWWLYSDDWQFMELALTIGIWLFLLPLLFTVSHRMLPFFSSNIIANYTIFQPAYSLWLFITGCVTHFVLTVLNQPEWLFLSDIPLAAIALLHTVRWQLHNSFKDRLLAVLHMAFFWLFIGMVLFSIQSLLLQFTGQYILGRSPLHAITIGFFASLLIAMASRVTMGHSGRMLILDNTSWYLFLGLQLAAIMRIFSDLQFDNALISNNLNLVAAALWLISLSVWFIKYAPIYLSARVDGRDG